MSMAVVTIVSRNYLHFANVLMNSVAAHHPESQRYVLVMDQKTGASETMANAEILHPEDLIPDQLERTVQQAIYQPYEYACALKPKLMLRALESADQVFFLDPDMQVFQPLTAATETLDKSAGVLLTPHRVTAPAYEDRELFEWALHAYGAYNAGFVAVTSAAKPFLEWWDSHLRRDCISDLDRFLWLDQRIIDLAPGFFDVDLFKDLGYNVGWWNLSERPLRKEGGTWYAGPEPLVLMHFSGVRATNGLRDYPQLIHSPKNPIASDRQHLDFIQELEDQYIADLQAQGFALNAKIPYGWNETPGGRRLSDSDRRGYRDAVLRAEAAGEAPPLPDDIPWGIPARVTHSVKAMEFPRSLLHDLRRARKALKVRR